MDQIEVLTREVERLNKLVTDLDTRVKIMEQARANWQFLISKVVTLGGGLGASVGAVVAVMGWFK